MLAAAIIPGRVGDNEVTERGAILIPGADSDHGEASWAKKQPNFRCERGGCRHAHLACAHGNGGSQGAITSAKGPAVVYSSIAVAVNDCPIPREGEYSIEFRSFEGDNDGKVAAGFCAFLARF